MQIDAIGVKGGKGERREGKGGKGWEGESGKGWKGDRKGEQKGDSKAGNGKGKTKGKKAGGKSGGKAESTSGGKAAGVDGRKPFEGKCHACGGWGHMKRDCRRGVNAVEDENEAVSEEAVAAAMFAEEYEPGDEVFWVLAIGEAEEADERLLLDSGSQVHTCTKDYAPRDPVRPSGCGEVSVGGRAGPHDSAPWDE